MKKYVLAVLFLLAAPSAFAQQATLTTPQSVTRNVPTSTNGTKLIVERVTLDRHCPASTGTTPCATVIVELQDASSNTLSETAYQVPANLDAPGTEFLDLLTAMETVRATETGNAGRKMNFRVLGYLADAGRLPAATLVP